MTVKEFYLNINESYDDAIARLMNESLITRLLKMFLDDKSMEDLSEGITKQDIELAFRGAHTLKGVAFNLGFNTFGNKTSELVELLRDRHFNEGYLQIYQSLQIEYEKIISLIKQL